MERLSQAQALKHVSHLRDFDYLEDKRWRFYRVIGDTHPAGRVRVCLSYVPTPVKSPYIRHGRSYLKVSDELGYIVVRANFPELIYKDSLTQQQFIALAIEDIKHTYYPRLALKRMVQHGSHRTLNGFVSLLVDNGIDIGQIGIHGSLLLGLRQESYDFDLVIYGVGNCHLFRRILPQLKEGGFAEAGDQVIKSLALNALRNHPVGLDRMYRAKLARSHTLLCADDCYFSIHFSYDEGEYEDIGANVGRPVSVATFKGVVLDDSKSYFTPSTYIVQDSNAIYQVLAYSFAYYCAATTGDEVEVFGTLRENNVVTIDEPWHYITPAI